jgi:ATP-dependent protease ClpP protease subunit
MSRAYPLMCRIRAEGGVTRMDIMDDIGADPWFGGGISAADVAGRLAGTRGPLDVHISSQGGVVGDGLAIYNTLLAHNGPVTTYIDGYALSVASVIAQAGQRRVASPVSAMMIHDAWGFAEGNQADMQRMAAALGANSDVIARAYADRAGGTVDQWRQVMQAETWYTADEALAAGLVDEVAGSSQLPAGLDLDALAARAPVRIMARLRAAADTGTGDDDGAPDCKTCGGKGRLKHPVTGKNSIACPSCKGTGTYSPDAAPDGGGMEDRGRRVRAAAGDEDDEDDGTEECKTCHGSGKILEGHRKCPDCKGTGRVPEGSQDEPQDRGGRGVRNLAGDEQLGDGWVRGADGTVRFDPDGDGDDDSTPEGDTDHDYFDEDGKQVKPVPPCPVARDWTDAQIIALIRRETAARLRNSIPDDVKSAFLEQVKKDPTSDLGAAIHRLSEWAASGSYPTGTTHADLEWMYDQICTELQKRDPDSEAGGNFPPAPSDAWRGGIRDCKALTDALAEIRKRAGGSGDGSGGAEDRLHLDLSGVDLEQLGNALKEAIK